MPACISEKSFCPIISFSKILLEPARPAGMWVSTEVVIQETDTGSVTDSFLNDEVFNKHLKIKIVQCTSRRVKRRIRRKIGAFAHLGSLPASGRNFRSQEVSVSEVLAGRSAKQYRTVDSNGDIKFNIPHQFRFRTAVETDPRHLTYFVFSYIDTAALGEELDLPIQLRKITGKINFRTVFNGGTLRGFSDSVVQDFRLVERAGKPNFRARRLENKLSRRIKKTASRSSSVLDEISGPGYFSQLLLSRSNDDTGAARFWFMLDFKNMVLDNTVFGNLLAKGSPRQLRGALSACRINSMALTRKRVVPLPGENYREFDPNNLEETIVSVSEKNGVIDPDSNISSIGNIRPTPIFGQDAERLQATGLRAFTGMDFDVANKTFGLYQYSLELEIQDATVDFVARKYKRLLNVSKRMPRYINILNIPDVYDLRDIDLEKHYKRKILPIIREYFGVLSTFRIMGKRKRQRLRQNMINITRPSTRDPRGVYTLERLVNDLLTELKITIESVSAAVLNDIPGNLASSTTTSGTARRTFTVKTTFAETYDVEAPNNVGFDYLSSNENERPHNFDGLRIVDFEDIQARMGSEMRKHFSDLDTNVTLEGLGGVNIPLITNVASTSICFAPSVARVGRSTTSLLNQGTDMWDTRGNNLLAARTLSYKMTGDVHNSLFRTKESDPLTTGEQEMEYYTAIVLAQVDVAVIPREYIERCEEDNFLLVENLFSPLVFVQDVSGSRGDTSTMRVRDPSVRTGLTSFGLISEFMLGGISSSPPNLGGISSSPPSLPTRSGHSSLASRFNFDNLNLSTPGNIFSNRLTNRDNGEIMSDLPFQLRAVVASSLGSPVVRYDFSNLSDPLSDYEMMSSIIYNYLLLQKVECLVGYEKTARGDVMLQRPIWELASLSKLSSMRGNFIICRMVRYEQGDVPSIGYQEGVDLPLYDEYFMIRKRA